MTVEQQIVEEARNRARAETDASVFKTARLHAEAASDKEPDYQKAAIAYDRIHAFVVDSLWQKTYAERYERIHRELLEARIIADSKK